MIMKRHSAIIRVIILGATLMAVVNCDASSDKTGEKKAAAGKADSVNSAATKNADDLPQDVKTFLLKLARQNLEAAVKDGSPVVPQNPPAITKEYRGCFVTLTKHGELRGCIGYIEGIKPLYEAVIDNAKNAALEDPRFSAVTPDELAGIEVEVSVLTKPEPLPHTSPQDLLDKLEPGKDGIILSSGYHQSTFLPQVWDQLPDKVDFLEHLSMKGGMPEDGWKTADVKRYRAVHFHE